MTQGLLPPPIPLPPLLDLAAAESLCRSLVVRLTEGGITLDGAAVERVSTPCLQVLAAAATSARDRQQPFRLCRPSDALQAAITDLGLCETIPFED